MTTDHTDFTDKKAISKEPSTVARPPMCKATAHACFIRVYPCNPWFLLGRCLQSESRRWRSSLKDEIRMANCPLTAPWASRRTFASFVGNKRSSRKACQSPRTASRPERSALPKSERRPTTHHAQHRYRCVVMQWWAGAILPLRTSQATRTSFRGSNGSAPFPLDPPYVLVA